MYVPLWILLWQLAFKRLVSLSGEVCKLPPPVIAIAPKICIIYPSSFQHTHKRFCVINETV